MAAVTISPANPSDVSRLAEIQRLAFAPSRINQLIFGQVTPTDFDASASARLLKAIADPVQAVWKAEKEGEIVGFALWGTPHEHVEEPKVEETEQQRVEKLKKRFPVGANYELADSFFGSLDLGIKTPHYHLGVLVTDPSHQRTGAGTALLRWGCTQADKEGVDAYLEASDVGIPVYQKAGFKLIREPIRGGSDNSMVLYPMHRSPLRLTRATSAQLPTIATIHRTAFAPTLWFASLWGNCSAEAFDAWFIAKGRGWLEGKEEHFIVAMRGEDVLGYALWEEKQGPEEGEVERETSWPVGTNVAVADGFNKDMHKYTSTIVGRYWHLHFLATSPLFQRSGAGKALIQWGIDRATKNGLSVYLEGGSEALPLYQKLGFTICGAPVAGIDGSFADTPVVLHPVVVSPAQTEDLAALATLHRRAFKGSPHKVVMFPNVKDDDYQAWNVHRMSQWIKPENEGKHWTVVAKRGGVVLGFGHYVLDERVEGKQEEGETALPSFPEGTDVEAARYLFETIGNSERSIRGKYIMLHQLATDPAHQKTRAGRALLQWGIDLHRRLGVDLYLDATPPGRRLYDSMGFKQWAPSLSAFGTVETYPMVLRSPSPTTTLPLTLAPAIPSDIPHLAPLFREAFEPTSIYQAMFHSCPSASYDAWNETRLTRWLADESASAVGAGGRRQKHWTVVARRGERIVGFGHWELHAGKGAAAEEEEEEPLPLPEGTDQEKGKKIFKALEGASEGIEGEFVMLHQLAIDPSLQRTGAGKALVQACLDFAQKHDPPLDLYLDSTDAGRPLYDHLGFVQWDKTTTVGEGWPETYPLVLRATRSD